MLQDLRASEVEVSEYSLEDDSSSAGGDQHDAAASPVRRESEAIIAAGKASYFIHLYLYTLDFLNWAIRAATIISVDISEQR